MIHHPNRRHSEVNDYTRQPSDGPSRQRLRIDRLVKSAAQCVMDNNATSSRGLQPARRLQRRMWKHSVIISLALSIAFGSFAKAQTLSTSPDDASDTGTASANRVQRVDPYQAVREGNRLLKDGQPAEALKWYEQAEREKPDALEIAFAEGLTQYHLGDYERAREQFRRVAAGRNAALADDALYSLGTTYHSDALLSRDDPQSALANLEQAMDHYQNVLAHNPDHAAARDAYRKAGIAWRQIKQQPQQPSQQSSDKKDKNQQDDKESRNENKNQEPHDPSKDQQQESNQDQPSDEQQQQEDQHPQTEPGQDQKQEQDQSSSSSSKADEDQQQTASSSEDQQTQEQQLLDAEQEEQVSREQAERKLREMMQTLRERKERRRESVRATSIQPVDKDW